MLTLKQLQSRIDSNCSVYRNDQSSGSTRCMKSLYSSSFTYTNTHLCKDEGNKLKVFIAVTSRPHNRMGRRAIRKTWGQYARRSDISLAFFIGYTRNEISRYFLKNEQYIFRDIIQGKFGDSYYNLTLKTISILDWAHTFCPKVKYLLKTDDDVFINIINLLKLIDYLDVETRAIYGRMIKKPKPFRNPYKKNYISWNQYSFERFPDFVTGPAYLMPGHITGEIYFASLNYSYIRLEDVFITGIMSRILKIKLFHISEFINLKVPHTLRNVKRAISIHDVRRFDQYNIWRIFNDKNSTRRELI
ncbi:hypothetical protein HHI36_019816 [Cryptolaemus montrouzieri]|uniref:Hexosyltransferase n=1 Tax=Cryptolaemus montrouzieri TaxID=559131 RepID=A0ABD2N9M1_9CUCU